MKFGVRQCANIVFRAKREETIGTQTFHVGQPVLYIDSATTASLEQSTTTVYAQGGRGNVRLISWEGEKTVTFTFTDALLSPIGFKILSGAGLFRKGNGPDPDGTYGQGGHENGTLDLVHFHTSALANMTVIGTAGYINLTSVLAEYNHDNVKPLICLKDAPIYIMEADNDGSVTGAIYSGTVSVVAPNAEEPDMGNWTKDTTNRYNNTCLKITGLKLFSEEKTITTGLKSETVMVDFYVDLPGSNVWQADITGDTFGGNYYVEADTLFRTTQGQDLAANITFPNVKIQSNFTMSFASSGDPSTFDFTMDAFPDYTYFDQTKKVICVLQILDYTKNTSSKAAAKPVMYHDDQLQHATDESKIATDGYEDGDIWYPDKDYVPSNSSIAVPDNG